MPDWAQIISDALDILKFDGAVQDTLAELREKWGAQVPALLDERFDAVCVQAKRRLIRKFGGHDSRIVGDRNALLLSVLGENVVRQSLCRLTHGINVHAVRSRSDHAAQSGSTELQIHVEALFNLLLIPGDRLKLRSGRLVKIWIVQP